ncbi:hypothetical protein PV08_01711 [Exophiala spinifera]|uniref:Nitroreductase domain-containing protein n=1 Tax=Exophiala spinifera TaxID=91928 RepID=A0A0D1Z0J7_9EURO|nr:uncharacterized protein PV08_01711 [Exophiala spinifera]KIW21131.1 hypothetical protein PV08_01711 [Exophiala spinifera]
MASTTSLLDAITRRRTIYDLSATSPIPDSRIIEIVRHITLHVPSSFNSQSARFLVLLHSEHRRLWDRAREVMAQVLPEAVFTTYFAPMITKYRGGHGTVLCFEDRGVVDALATQYDGVIPPREIPPYALWCALEAEGMGANLQHYNPHIDAMVRDTWDLSPDWILKAQLVFGVPANNVRIKKELEKKPVAERVLVRGGISP